MFQKGVSGNPAGKKPGTKDKKWQSAQAVWDMLMAEWNELKPNERARMSLEVFKLHFERAISHLPKDQNDSVTSANKLMEEMHNLEAKFGNRTTDTPSVDDRTPKI